jgi:N-acetylneuraminic acid mutarotase
MIHVLSACACLSLLSLVYGATEADLARVEILPGTMSTFLSSSLTNIPQNTISLTVGGVSFHASSCKAFDAANDILYIFGGCSGSTASNCTDFNSNLYALNVVNYQWTQLTWTVSSKGGPLTARGYCAMAANNGNIFIFGGRDSSSSTSGRLSTLFILAHNFSGMNDFWKGVRTSNAVSFADITPKGGSNPGNRFSSQMFIKDSDTLILFGGQSGSNFLADVYQYVVSSDSWTTLNSNNVFSKNAPAVCFRSNTLFVLGGVDSTSE